MLTSKKYILEQLTKDKRFNDEVDYSPFFIEGFFDEEDPDLKDLLNQDPDIYIAGTNIGGIELSRESFWA